MTVLEPAATAADERPLYFPGEHGPLAGVLTQPVTAPNGVGLLLLSGAGRKGGGVPSPGRNRMWVRLARTMAGSGFTSLRFDMAGIGESVGSISTHDIANPSVADVLAAVEVLRQTGVQRIVLLGTCFGARSNLAAAHLVPELAGLAMFAAPVLDFGKGGDRGPAPATETRAAILPASWYLRKAAQPTVLRGLLDRDRRTMYRTVLQRRVRRALRRGGSERRRFRWASRAYVEQLTAVTGRPVGILMIYGDEDTYLSDLQNARRAELRKVFERAGERIRLVIVAGKVHGFTSLAVQDATLDETIAWLEHQFPNPKRMLDA